MLKSTAAGLMICLLSGIGSTETSNQTGKSSEDAPEAEFHLARLKYATIGGAGSHGFINPWWAVDYPFAEEHFLPALRRITNISVADGTRHLELTDDRLFEYPFLWLQQPGNGNWQPTAQEAGRLKEYLVRGGFLFVDDFHGEYEWSVFKSAIQQVLPDRAIVEIPDDDPFLHVFYDLSDRIQIPGRRHLMMSRGGCGTPFASKRTCQTLPSSPGSKVVGSRSRSA